MNVSARWMPVLFQSGKIIFIGRGSKTRLNPSLSEIRASTTFKSDMPSQSEGDGWHTYLGEKRRIRHYCKQNLCQFQVFMRFLTFPVTLSNSISLSGVKGAKNGSDLPAVIENCMGLSVTIVTIYEAIIDSLFFLDSKVILGRRVKSHLLLMRMKTFICRAPLPLYVHISEGRTIFLHFYSTFIHQDGQS